MQSKKVIPYFDRTAKPSNTLSRLVESMNNETLLILTGAVAVGKSTLVSKLAKSRKGTYVIDLKPMALNTGKLNNFDLNEHIDRFSNTNIVDEAQLFSAESIDRAFANTLEHGGKLILVCQDIQPISDVLKNKHLHVHILSDAESLSLTIM